MNKDEEIKILRGLLLEMGARVGVILPVDEYTIEVFDKGFGGCIDFHRKLHIMLFHDPPNDLISEPKEFVNFREK